MQSVYGPGRLRLALRAVSDALLLDMRSPISANHHQSSISIIYQVILCHLVGMGMCCEKMMMTG